MLPAVIRIPTEVDVVRAIHRLHIGQRVTSELVEECLDLAETKGRFVVKRFSSRAKRYPPVVLEHGSSLRGRPVRSPAQPAVQHPHIPQTARWAQRAVMP